MLNASSKTELYYKPALLRFQTIDALIASQKGDGQRQIQQKNDQLMASFQKPSRVIPLVVNAINKKLQN